MKKVKEPKAPKPPKEPKAKAASLFDYISWLTNDKRAWDDLTRDEQKGFNVFIINRCLSMELAFTEAINDMQEYTMSMPKEFVWKVYSAILPSQKIYFTYIKSSKIEGVDEKDIIIFVKHFNCSEKQAIEYLQLLVSKGMQTEIENIKSNYKYE